ncbi:Transposase family Tnp2 protein [Ceratobasidium sp. AG-Ba]|nr:Transposase family Tnp2 protein [Ceratobasidium sp. AG-Ba]
MNRTNYDKDVRLRAQRAPLVKAEPGTDCRRGRGLRLRSVLWVGILRPIATVKTHRSRYGRYVHESHDEALGRRLNDPDNEPPARMDSDEDMADHFAPVPASPRPHLPSRSRSRSPPAGSRPMSRACSRSRSRSYSRSHFRSLSRSQSRCRSRSMSRSASPHLGSPARSRSGSEADDVDIRLRAIDTNEDALFYQNILHENRPNSPPPLNIRHDNELGIQVQPHGEERANDEVNQSGDEAPGQNNDVPGEPGGQPAQPVNHAEIFVPPPELGGDPEPPNEDWCAAFGEHPTLRNIYFRTWIRAAFYGATHDDIRAILESQKLSLESLAHIVPLPDDLLLDIGRMARTLRSLEHPVANVTRLSTLLIFTVLSAFDIMLVSNRHEGDEPDEEAKPLRWQDWINQTPPNRRFGDMSEAWGWRTQTAGLERTYDGETYADYQVSCIPWEIFCKWKPFGQWVVPGPKEPKGYAMDEILKPLVDDLILLSNGVDLPVYNMNLERIEQRRARIKCTGHVALTSEHEGCLYCGMRKCFLCLERGYDIAGYNMRIPHEPLQRKHEWLRAPMEEKEDIQS